MLTPYPDSLPTEAVQNLIRMISTKSFDKIEFALALWNLEGYALSKLPTLGEFKFYGSTAITDEDALTALESIEPAPGTVGGLIPNPLLKMILTWALNKALEIL